MPGGGYGNKWMASGQARRMLVVSSERGFSALGRSRAHRPARPGIMIWLWRYRGWRWPDRCCLGRRASATFRPTSSSLLSYRTWGVAAPHRRPAPLLITTRNVERGTRNNALPAGDGRADNRPSRAWCFAHSSAPRSPFPAPRSSGALARLGQHLGDHLVGGQALGLALEVEDDTVAQGGAGEVAHVLEGDVEAAFQQRADLRRQDDRLRAARAGPVADVLADGGGAVALSGWVARRRRTTYSRTWEAIGTSRASRLIRSTWAPLAALRACGRSVVVVRARISPRSAAVGKRTSSLKRKRSSCASGSG